MKGRHAVSSMMEKIKERGQGIYFEVGRIKTYDAKTHTASVEILAMDATIEGVRIGTPRIGTRFNLKQGEECLVIFREGDPMNSEPVAFPVFYSTESPPRPDSGKSALYGGEEFVHETKNGARDECYDSARRLLFNFIELGALATYGVLLGEPCAATYNAHMHITGTGVPVIPPLPPFWWFAVSHISQTVKVQP